MARTADRYNDDAYRSGHPATLLGHGLDIAMTRDGLDLALCISTANGLRYKVDDPTWEHKSHELLIRLADHPNMWVKRAALLLMALKQKPVEGKETSPVQQQDLDCFFQTAAKADDDRILQAIAFAGHRRMLPSQMLNISGLDQAYAREVLDWISRTRGEGLNT